MRRAVPAFLALALLLAGCGGSDSSGNSAGDKLTAKEAVLAATTKPATSSRMAMTTTTAINGQKTVLSMTGVIGGSPSAPLAEMTMKMGPTTMRQVIVGGVLYMQMPGDSAYQRLPLKELSGTPLAQSANPASGAELLKALGDDVKEVGKETVRGTSTTHYKGTISVKKAMQLENEVTRRSMDKLSAAGVETIPTDVYLDDDGRIRRLVQNIAMTAEGQKVTTVTQVDTYDFGVKVAVKAPPASQVKDGTELLNTFKKLYGG